MASSLAFDSFCIQRELFVQRVRLLAGLLHRYTCYLLFDMFKLRLHVRTGSGWTRDHRGTTFTLGTRHGMGSADTRPHGSPSKPSCTQDEHVTAPSCWRVNGRARARRNGRRQRDLFAFVMAFQQTRRRIDSPILRKGTCLTLLMMGVTTVCNEYYKILTSCVNAIVCPSRDSWHSLGACPPVPCLV